MHLYPSREGHVHPASETTACLKGIFESMALWQALAVMLAKGKGTKDGCSGEGDHLALPEALLGEDGCQGGSR